MPRLLCEPCDRYQIIPEEEIVDGSWECPECKAVWNVPAAKSAGVQEKVKRAIQKIEDLYCQCDAMRGYQCGLHILCHDARTALESGAPIPPDCPRCLLLHESAHIDVSLMADPFNH